MALDTVEKVELEDGKYTILRDCKGSFVAYRYKDYWRDLCGDKLIHSLVDRILELEKQLSTK